MKTVLITGATSGIGLSLTQYYASKGYDVIACGRNKHKLEMLIGQYNNITPLLFDITNTEQINGAAKSIDKAIDILIFNAGDCEYIEDIKNFDAELFERVIKVNLISAGYLVAGLINHLVNGGQLVFVSSIVTLASFPKSHAYGASKAGLDYLANTLRFDLKVDNIDVTLIKPGFIKTPLTDKNNFSMPFLLTSEQAAQRIYRGVSQRKKQVYFPKRFVYILKFMRLLPAVLWQKLFLKGSY